MHVYVIDVDNMEAYSDHWHYVLDEAYARKEDAAEMLEGKGFKPVHDKWRGDTVWRWEPDEVDEYGNPVYENAPFISSYYGVEATIMKLEVLE